MAATLLVIEKFSAAGQGRGVKALLGWVALVLAMGAVGLVIAVAGVKALY